MDFELSPRQKEAAGKVASFMEAHVYPAVPIYERQQADGEPWKVIPVIEELKARARALGLWNMFMPPDADDPPMDGAFAFEGLRLSNLEYAPVAEILGRVSFAPEVFNCSAPDTGNMEILHRFGTLAQKERWLRPLMEGEIRSAFLMTEPAAASSDATHIETRIERDGDSYVVNGRKWWSSGAGDPRCRLAVVMGKTDPAAPPHRQQSMLLVPLDSPGVKIVRMLPVYGYDDAPHGHAEIVLENVRVPAAEGLLLGEGRGFEIAQARLGPGRLHHCMRAIGAAEVALEKMCKRLLTRTPFGRPLAEQSVWEERIARARMLCLKAADMMDKAGGRAARGEIAMIKVQAPRMALRIIDDAVQAHGGAGVSDDFGLARAWAQHRVLRIADGPDEVHARTVARRELARYRDLADPA